MGIGIIASFAAREVFVSTMSTVYNVGKYDRSASKTSDLKGPSGNSDGPTERRSIPRSRPSR